MARRRKRLSEADLDHWRAVAATAVPLRTPPAALSPAPDPAPGDGASVAPPPQRAPSQPGPPLRELRLGAMAAQPPLRPAAPRPLAMDARLFARMKRGKLHPERRIDLHGMTLDQAHPALSRFIMTAQAQGCRMVMVITGKGRDLADDDPIPRARGVLRRSVPLWLGTPPLRQAVLEIVEAHGRHGGSGAWYVYLARRR